MKKATIISIFLAFSAIFYLYLNQINSTNEIIKWKKNHLDLQNQIIKSDSVFSKKESDFRDSILIIISKSNSKIDSLNELIINNTIHENRLEKEIDNINNLIGELPNF